MSKCNKILKSQRYCKVLNFFIDIVLGRLVFYKVAWCPNEKTSGIHSLPGLHLWQLTDMSDGALSNRDFFLIACNSRMPKCFTFKKVTKMRKLDFSNRKKIIKVSVEKNRRQTIYTIPSPLPVPSQAGGLLLPSAAASQVTLSGSKLFPVPFGTKKFPVITSVSSGCLLSIFDCDLATST